MSDVIDCKSKFRGPNESFYEDNKHIVETPSYDGISFSDAKIESVNWKKLRRASNNLKWRPQIRSFIVTRNNNVIWEDYFLWGKNSHCNNIHSIAKSILSVLVGIAVDKNLLNINDKINKFFPDMPTNDITIFHLLTMTSGFSWVEDETEYIIEKSVNWVESILNRKIVSIAGETFNYCTGNSHVLSAIIHKVTGNNLCKFAYDNLFNKLGMSIAQWSRDRQDIFCGGFNMYISPIDLIKFSLLILNKGEYNNNRIVSKDWINKSTMPLINVDGMNYCYHWWLDRIRSYDVLIAWGYGGQFIYIIPELNITTVITCDTYYYSKDYDFRSIIRRYIIPSVI